jgi:hypothetical protein
MEFLAAAAEGGAAFTTAMPAHVSFVENESEIWGALQLQALFELRRRQPPRGAWGLDCLPQRPTTERARWPVALDRQQGRALETHGGRAVAAG